MTKEIIVLGLVIIIGISGVNLLRYLFRELKELFLTCYLSNRYSFEKAIKLLKIVIGDMVGRYIQTHILEGKRSESVDIMKTKIPYDYNNLSTDVDKITGLVLKMLQPRYIARLEMLYINEIEKYITLLVKDKYVEIINILIDKRTIQAIKRTKRLSNQSDVKLYDTVDSILSITGGLDGFLDIVGDFSGLPIEKVEHIMKNSNSNIGKENASAFIQMQNILKSSGVTLDMVIKTLQKEEEDEGEI